MANTLPLETRVHIVAALTEGNAVRATARLFEVDKNTVLTLGLRVGDGCAALHNRLVRGVRALIIQGDETWSFIHKHPQEGGAPRPREGPGRVGRRLHVRQSRRDEQAGDLLPRRQARRRERGRLRA